MGLENIAAGNGIPVAVTGMAIVFAGLTLISLFVSALPRILGDGVVRDRRRGRGKGPKARNVSGPAETGVTAPELEDDPALLAAIAFAVQAELAREATLDHQRITQTDREAQQVWTAIGKMRTLSTRL